MISYDSSILLWDYCNLVIGFSNGVPIGPDHSAGKTNMLILTLDMKYIPGTSMRLKKCQLWATGKYCICLTTYSWKRVVFLLGVNQTGVSVMNELQWCELYEFTLEHIVDWHLVEPNTSEMEEWL